MSVILVLSTIADSQVLGELLLDFLHLFGEDFDMAREGFSVRGGGFRFNCHDNPPHPQAGDPIVIEVIANLSLHFSYRYSYEEQVRCQ